MAIKFNNVSFAYPSIGTTLALREVNLDISAEGEFIAVVGHTGSGKSTLIQHMNALLTPSEGKVSVFDMPVAKGEKLTPIRKRVGMVFQFPEYQLFEETVEKDIMFGPINFGLSKEEAKAKAREVIKTVGLEEEHLERSPFNLSGGQMRRVAIAGILAMEPEVLILDEPTVGLDPQGQREMMDLFMDIHKKTNQTIILVTHNMDVVTEYANRVIVLQNARKAYDGKVRELFRDRELLKKYNLDIPAYMSIVAEINKVMGTNYDEVLFNLDEVVSELTEE